MERQLLLMPEGDESGTVTWIKWNLSWALKVGRNLPSEQREKRILAKSKHKKQLKAYV